MSETALMGFTASISPQWIRSEIFVRGDTGKHKWFIWDYPQLNYVTCNFSTTSSFTGEQGSDGGGGGKIQQ